MSDIKQMIDELISENINLKSRLVFIEEARNKDKQALERAEKTRLDLESPLNAARLQNEEKVSLRDYEKLEEENKKLKDMEKVFRAANVELGERYKKAHQRILDLENEKVNLESFMDEVDEVFRKFGYTIRGYNGN